MLTLSFYTNESNNWLRDMAGSEGSSSVVFFLIFYYNGLLLTGLVYIFVVLAPLVYFWLAVSLFDRLFDYSYFLLLA